MKTLSYMLLYGILATCGLAVAEETASPRGGVSPQLQAYTPQHRVLVSEWLQLAHGVAEDPVPRFDRFDRYASALLSPSQRRKSWYLLGHGFYERGDFEAAQAALARVDGRLPEEIRQDFTLLQAQVSLARGAHERAAKLLESLAGRRSASPYAQYNLAVAQLRSGRQSQAIETLEAMGRLNAESAEEEALRDQANITLGHLYLEQGKSREARQALQRASHAGPYARQALLALGWVEWQARNPRLAQSAWVELLEDDPASPITLEALSGVPHALWRLESHTQARKRFDAAITAYQEQLNRLDEIMEQADGPAWLTTLLADASPQDLEAQTVWQRIRRSPLAPYLSVLMDDPGLRQALNRHLTLLRLNNLTASTPRLKADMENTLGIAVTLPLDPGLAGDLQHLRQQIPGLLARQRARVRAQVLEVLARQREQLRQYLLDAQYARARLLDELTDKKS